MINLGYKAYEKLVYDWLLKNHSNNCEFTFSVRQKASKGAELDYFIGTKKSEYFGTTFWHIPVAYPGSSSDLINIIFDFVDDKPKYYWQFTQPKDADGDQNKTALQLIQNIAPRLSIEGREYYQSKENKKTFTFYFSSPIRGYENIEALFTDLLLDIELVVPIVHEEIIKLKEINPDFIAERISLELFQKMLSKMEERFKKYTTNEIIVEMKEEFKGVKSPIPLNQILYGPPGTGKTYKLKSEYFDQFTTRESNITAEQHFVSQAQDLSWWQAIALALLEVNKAKVSEVMANRWVAHKIENSNSKNARATVWGTLQMHTKENNEFVNYKLRQAPLIFDKDANSNWTIDQEEVANQAAELRDILESVNNFKPNPDKLINRYVFTTFHQSFSYEDFIEGIKPVLDDESGDNLEYEIQDGVFKRICKRAEKDLDNDYAIFIDEINRGNVASIFGELITLIEEDKRAGKKEALEVTLPYSKQKFSVPKNLYIIGTMNTADRSVEALDSALRRRFSFQEMMPKSDLLSSSRMYWNLLWKYKDVGWEDSQYQPKEKALFDFIGAAENLKSEKKDIWAKFEDEGKNEGQVATLEKYDYNGINLVEVLKTINNRIEVLIDRDHTIGHSYFMSLEGKENIEEATKAVFKDKVIPLLQEYFFNDYGKIQLVLGEGFVEQKSHDKVLFHKVEGNDIEVDEYLEKPNYTFTIESKKFELKAALDVLLNGKKKKENSDE